MGEMDVQGTGQHELQTAEGSGSWSVHDATAKAVNKSLIAKEKLVPFMRGSARSVQQLSYRDPVLSPKTT